MKMGGRGASSGIKRGIKGAGGGNVEKQERGSSNVNPQVTNITRDSLDADDSKALEKLREMAQRGEIPDKDREEVFTRLKKWLNC